MINRQIAEQAKLNLDSGPWSYLVGGAENELALRRNRHAFQRWSFVPQGLHDLSKIDSSTQLFNKKLDVPIIAAPIGGITQFHKEGDFAWVKGLAKSNITGVVSGVTRVEFENLLKEVDSSFFFQLYFFGDDQWVEKKLKMAEACGYQAIVVTIDTKCFGQRERDIIGNYDSRKAGWRTTPEPPNRDRNLKLTVKELQKMRGYTKLPFIVKGVFSLEDVHMCLDMGVDAIWISNHGGRQLDYVSSGLSALVELAPVCHSKSIPVIYDGGIRRGSEALMAYLLGADVVAVGRLPIYGLIVDGENGVKQVMDNLKQEFLNTMGQIGLLHLNESYSDRLKRVKPEEIFGYLSGWDNIEG